MHSINTRTPSPPSDPFFREQDLFKDLVFHKINKEGSLANTAVNAQISNVRPTPSELSEPSLDWSFSSAEDDPTSFNSSMNSWLLDTPLFTPPLPSHSVPPGHGVTTICLAEISPGWTHPAAPGYEEDSCDEESQFEGQDSYDASYLAMDFDDGDDTDSDSDSPTDRAPLRGSPIAAVASSTLGKRRSQENSDEDDLPLRAEFRLKRPTHGESPLEGFMEGGTEGRSELDREASGASESDTEDEDYVPEGPSQGVGAYRTRQSSRLLSLVEHSDSEDDADETTSFSQHFSGAPLDVGDHSGAPRKATRTRILPASKPIIEHGDEADGDRAPSSLCAHPTESCSRKASTPSVPKKPRGRSSGANQTSRRAKRGGPSTNGEKFVQCIHKWCHATFVGLGEMERHVRTARVHNTEMLYKCDECHKPFTRPDAATRHYKTCALNPSPSRTSRR